MNGAALALLHPGWPATRCMASSPVAAVAFGARTDCANDK